MLSSTEDPPNCSHMIFTIVKMLMGSAKFFVSANISIVSSEAEQNDSAETKVLKLISVMTKILNLSCI